MPLTTSYRRRRYRPSGSRYRRKKAPYRRRSVRYPARPTIARPINSRVVWFKRKFLLSSFNLENTDIPIGYSFKMTDFADYARYQDMYDFYKLTSVMLEFVYRHNMSDVSNGSTDLVPLIHSAPDWNDGTAPADIDELLNKGGYRRKRLISTCKYLIKPASLVGVTTVNVPTSIYGSQSQWRRWQNWEYPEVTYYGFKAYIQNCNSATTQTCDVYATYTFACKDPK